MRNSSTSLTFDTLLDGAMMYASAADAVNEKFPSSWHVLSQLLGTSIELALKAFLAHNGFDEKQLRALGHNLSRLLREAEKMGFYSTGSRSFVLAVSGRNYKDRLFVYPREGRMLIISPWRLRHMAHEVITEVFALIKGADALVAEKQTPGLCIQSVYPENPPSA